MLGVRLYSFVGVLLGAALVAVADPALRGWRDRGNPFFAGAIGGAFMVVLIWWTRFVGVLFVITGAVGIVKPSVLV